MLAFEFDEFLFAKLKAWESIQEKSSIFSKNNFQLNTSSLLKSKNSEKDVLLLIIIILVAVMGTQR